jgi:hypothetical protein
MTKTEIMNEIKRRIHKAYPARNKEWECRGQRTEYKFTLPRPKRDSYLHEYGVEVHIRVLDEEIVGEISDRYLWPLTIRGSFTVGKKELKEITRAITAFMIMEWPKEVDEIQEFMKREKKIKAQEEKDKQLTDAWS